MYISQKRVYILRYIKLNDYNNSTFFRVTVLKKLAVLKDFVYFVTIVTIAIRLNLTKTGKINVYCFEHFILNGLLKYGILISNKFLSIYYKFCRIENFKMGNKIMNKKKQPLEDAVEATWFTFTLLLLYSKVLINSNFIKIDLLSQ